MLTNLEIHNFKSIKELQMQIADLNILIGPNNSGKTSVLQTLALLKQSISQLAFTGPLVNLGNFREAVYRHDRNEAIKFSLQFSTTGLPTILNNMIGRGRELYYSVSIKEGGQGEPLIQSSMLGAHQKEIIRLQRNKRETIVSEFRSINFDTRGILPRAQAGEVTEIEKYNQIYELFTEELSHFLYYLSARRGVSVRTEPVDTRYSRRPDDVGLLGENTTPVLAYVRDDADYSNAMDKIGFWLERFGLTKLIATIVEGPGHSLKATNKEIDVQSNVVDVGFGVNQLIPVLVQCIYAPRGSLILIEQPEAHLHPRAQAEVADFLIDVVNYGNRVMVETHSEHLLLRLQRRLAEKKIGPEAVNVCYFEQTKEGTRKSDMKMDESGYFVQPIPKGFFEEGFQEALAHIKASRLSGDGLESTS